VRLLVTGAGGFLGAAVAARAAASGHDVVAVVRDPGGARVMALGPDVKVCVADLSDHAAVSALLAAERPDVLVHAAWGGLGRAERASAAQVERNLLPTLQLIEQAGAAGVSRFVGIGSQDEYGPLNRRATEDDRAAPVSFYGAAKLAAAQLGSIAAAQAGMTFVWLRLFATYGPGDNPSWLIPALARQFLAGTCPAMTPGTQLWDYLYIDDAADGVIAAATVEGVAGILNLSSGDPVAVRAVAERLRDLAAPGLILRLGEVAFGINQILHMEGDNRRLRVATGWQPRVTLDDGLARTVAALRG
jgi:nucleoside-diphosphate-sugar epimerase